VAVESIPLAPLPKPVPAVTASPHRLQQTMDLRGRRLVEACSRVDVRSLRQYSDGTVTLPNGWVVRLDWTPCHLGGRRPWFLCPRCGRRVRILYDANPVTTEDAVLHEFVCRRCGGLAYQTENATRDRRVLLKAQRLRERLGGTGNLREPFPEKPREMHWRTYNRLRARGQWADQRAMVALLGQMARSSWYAARHLKSEEVRTSGPHGGRSATACDSAYFSKKRVITMTERKDGPVYVALLRIRAGVTSQNREIPIPDSQMIWGIVPVLAVSPDKARPSSPVRPPSSRARAPPAAP
jgi:hypothetical protein